MPPQARKPDVCAGHGCYPSRPPTTWSQNVKVNGLNAIRHLDQYAAHGCPVCVPHPGGVAKGSTTVYINDRMAARLGDPIDCGTAIAVGSPNVIVGG